MLFEGKVFLWGILPAALVALHLCRRYRPGLAAPVLLAVSLIFYAREDLASLPLLLGLILVNYWISGAVHRAGERARAWLRLGVIVNVAPLLWYKYGPASLHAGHVTGLSLVAGIPLGLSFYSFTNLSCLLDLRRPGAMRLPPLSHAMLVAFFPQLPAGPISRYRDLAPQVAQLGRAAVPAASILAGLSLFLFGLAKQAVLARTVGADVVDPIYDAVITGADLTFLDAWLLGWGFLIQLYFDFSGYSDMAIGLALCFGIALPANFNSPLKAASPNQFVDHWHMSLVAWVREYLYQPIFRSVRQAAIGDIGRRRVLAWAVATIVSMTVIGAWHGNGVALILNGVISGIGLVLLQLPALSANRAVRAPPLLLRRMRGLAARIALLAALSALGLVLRIDGLQRLGRVLRAMTDWRSLSIPPALARLLPYEPVSRMPARGFFPALAGSGSPGQSEIIVLITAVIVFAMPNTMQIFGILPYPSRPGTAAPRAGLRWRATPAWGAVAAGLVLLVLLFGASDNSRGFIYANL